MMKKFGNNIWTIEGDTVRMFRFLTFATRMSVIRLNDGGLWLHSPIAPTPERIEAVKELGEVRFIIAPNKIHSLYIKPWADAFPEAKIWVSPRFTERHENFPHDGVLSDDPEISWADDIDQVVMQGHPFLDEVIFLHKPSKTVLVTDLIQNHDARQDNIIFRTLKKWVGIGAPDGGTAMDVRLSFKDKDAGWRSCQKMEEWDYDKVILCHGSCRQENGKAYVQKSFQWLNKGCS